MRDGTVRTPREFPPFLPRSISSSISALTLLVATQDLSIVTRTTFAPSVRPMLYSLERSSAFRAQLSRDNLLCRSPPNSSGVSYRNLITRLARRLLID